MFNITESEQNLQVICENMGIHFDIFLNETNNIDLINLFTDNELKCQFIELLFNAILQSEFEIFLSYKKHLLSM